MNQILTAGAAFILAGVLWGLGRKPKGLMTQSLKKYFSSSQISLTLKTKSSNTFLLNSFTKGITTHWSPPANSRESHQLRKKLLELMSSGPDQRLEAVDIASKWGDKSVIPILKRGLRDSDTRVVILAAQSIDKFKGFSQKANIDHQTDRPPRNVFLMR